MTPDFLCTTDKYVFSLPIMLRIYFRNNRWLLKQLCKIANECLLEFLRLVTHRPDGQLGMVMSIHTFGEYMGFNCHLHALVADGLFSPSGMFYVAPKVSTKPLEQMFRVQVIRNPFSEQKMTYNEENGIVIYRSRMHAKTKRNFEILSAEDFIAAITQHIPERGFQMVRYYGWYSNRAKGERAKKQAESSESENPVGIQVIDVSDYQPRRLPSKKWRELTKQVWEVDSFDCPRCGSEMKLIANTSTRQ